MWYVYFLGLSNGDICVGSKDDLRRRLPPTDAAGHLDAGVPRSEAQILPLVLLKSRLLAHLADGSGKVELMYLVEDVDRYGNVRLYVKRRGQRKIRMGSPPGSQAFLDEYRAAIAGNGAPKPSPRAAVPAARSSLRWLVEQYYDSADYKTLGERTRHVRRQFLMLCASNPCRQRPRSPLGHCPTRRCRQARYVHCGIARRQRRKRQTKAQGASAGLPNGSYYNNDLAERNPARDVPYIKTGSQGFHT